MRRKSGPSVIAAAASQASNASTRAEIGTADRQPDLCAARVLIVLAPGADKARRRPSGAQFGMFGARRSRSVAVPRRSRLAVTPVA
jgi:hypothetical protein